MTPTLVLAIVTGWLFAVGVYLLLRRSLAKVLLGLALLAHGANLAVFTAAGLDRGRPPLVPEERQGLSPQASADPLPQALILTAIVIGFGVTAFTLTLFRQTYQTVQTDDLDDLRATDQ